ncbi:hypothetical protein M0Q50_04575 [bacterium]|jgi:hypothetical protein|nr:hypothetical protein [bacterium]
MDFIQGEKFYNIADFMYSLDISDYNPINTTLDINKLNDINIIYTHTTFINNLFNVIRNIDDKKFIIISHNSDDNIYNLNNMPDNIIKWYSQNMCVIDNRVDCLPIGLENNRWFSDIHKKEKMISILNTNKNYKKLVYMNHNINTNKNERLEPYILLQDKKFVSCENGMNGQNFDNYLDNIYNHKFVISPAGNGIDTHRRWECLYLNTIPIEKRNNNNKYFEDLPICFIDNWSDITEDFLNNEYERIINTNFNLEKLNFEYWKKIIKNNI